MQNVDNSQNLIKVTLDWILENISVPKANRTNRFPDVCYFKLEFSAGQSNYVEIHSNFNGVYAHAIYRTEQCTVEKGVHTLIE